jgi:hypothetical protein
MAVSSLAPQRRLLVRLNVGAAAHCSMHERHTLHPCKAQFVAPVLAECSTEAINRAPTKSIPAASIPRYCLLLVPTDIP